MVQIPLPQPGSVVGEFRVDSVLGQGGYAIVYKVTHLERKYPAALKVMLPDVAASVAGVAERFMREIHLAARLAHPNIVRLYAYGQTEPQGGLLWMAMELVKGVEIAEILKADGAMEPGRALTIMIQALEGLQAAHVLKIVHRDLKPSNIMLARQPDGEVAKVLDFGIGKSLGDHEDPSVMDVTGAFGKQMLATPHYASPELLKGKTVGPASDVYAMGLIFYEMLTGVQAINADSIFEVYAKQAYQEVEFPPWLAGSPVAAVITKATQKDPSLRYPDAGALCEALKSLDPSGLKGPSARDRKKEEKARKKQEKAEQKERKKEELKAQQEAEAQAQVTRDRSIALQAAALEAMRQGGKREGIPLGVIIGGGLVVAAIAAFLIVTLVLK